MSTNQLIKKEIYKLYLKDLETVKIIGEVAFLKDDIKGSENERDIFLVYFCQPTYIQKIINQKMKWNMINVQK